MGRISAWATGHNRAWSIRRRTPTGRSGAQPAPSICVVPERVFSGLGRADGPKDLGEPAVSASFHGRYRACAPRPLLSTGCSFHQRSMKEEQFVLKRASFFVLMSPRSHGLAWPKRLSAQWNEREEWPRGRRSCRRARHQIRCFPLVRPARPNQSSIRRL